MTETDNRLQRIEQKLDELGEAIIAMARMAHLGWPVAVVGMGPQEAVAGLGLSSIPEPDLID